MTGTTHEPATEAEQHNALVQFFMELFGDPETQEAFRENPARCLDLAGVGHASPHQVQAAVAQVAPTIAPAAPAPSGGGGGGWQPSVPSHGSTEHIVQNIFNDYSKHYTINGDGNVVAIGDKAVAIGGDNEGNVNTGDGSTTGNENQVGNTEDNREITVDQSTHGDGSGNTTTATATDNSTTDNHGQARVGAEGGNAGAQDSNAGGAGTGQPTTGPTPTGPTPAALSGAMPATTGSTPFQPAPIAMDPTLAVAATATATGDSGSGLVQTTLNPFASSAPDAFRTADRVDAAAPGTDGDESAVPVPDHADPFSTAGDVHLPDTDADPLGIDHLGTDHSETDPLGTDHLGTDPLGTALGADPLDSSADPGDPGVAPSDPGVDPTGGFVDTGVAAGTEYHDFGGGAAPAFDAGAADSGFADPGAVADPGFGG
ncbi:MAG: IniB N-terminal domain-containing protein [Gordonia sp. (in: high G+C Gram-positive bacteria)]